MNRKPVIVLSVALLLAAALLPAAAAPLATPCAPGAVYDPACDVNQNGVIDVLDIQLTAGHWTQSGLFPLDPYWSLTGNGSTTPGTHYVGTSDNQALQLRVNNSRALLIQPNGNGSHNLIGGYDGNTMTAGVYGGTIAGGGASSFLNTVTDHFGTVSGGRLNQAGDNDAFVTTGQFATVGGGVTNTAAGERSTVAGGAQNTASGIGAAIGGGTSNLASETYSTVGGGTLGNATGNRSTVGGGSENTASGSYSAVGGGRQNTAAGMNSTVAGGDGNSAQNYGSTVAGGVFNSTSGDYAIVAGGLSNAAAGSLSFAAGRRAKANHAGTFVWADNTDADFATTTANTFRVRATGGSDFIANNGVYNLKSTNDGNGDGTRTYAATSLGNNWAALFASNTAGSPGVYASTNGTYSGYFEDHIYVASGCTGCTLMYVAQNAGDATLQPGDLVAVAGVADALAGTADPVLRVQPSGAAAPGVVGVVFSRATVTRGEKEGQVLDSVQAAEGAVQPGEYLLIVVQGLAQVRIAKNETVTPGQRLKAGGVDGQASVLQSTTVNGLVVVEGVPVIGVVLDTPDPTSGLAPVMVTLR